MAAKPIDATENITNPLAHQEGGQDIPISSTLICSCGKTSVGTSDYLTMSNFLSMGKETYRIPLRLFQENREKLVASIQSQVGERTLVVLVGGESATRFDSDNEPIFRQESYFWWLTGVKEPDCSLIIDRDGSITLLIPKLPADYATIMGHIKSPEEWKEMYQVDHVKYTEELEETLEDMVGSNGNTAKILLMEGPNSDSGNTYNLAPKFKSDKLISLQDKTTLFPILAECRVQKSPSELALLEHVAQISSFAHSYVMRNLKPGMMEYQAESLFLHYAYVVIDAMLGSQDCCGPNKPVFRCVSAQGNPIHGISSFVSYASDITCSFPANGKFSEKYRPIYSAVLKAQVTVYDMCKPGASWVECHKAAEKTILQALAEIGIVKVGADTSLDELVEKRLGAVFMPHGLGHFIGIDCHD
eukprot:scaffold23881_cov127-Cylindrotheca_fusiformis.AAC.1